MTTRALSRELRGLGIDPDAPALPGTFEPSVNEEPLPEPSQPAVNPVGIHQTPRRQAS